MPFTIDWLIPYRVVDERMWGRITYEELLQRTDRIVAMLTEAKAREPGKLAYMLLDVSAVEQMPPIYLMVKQAMPALRFDNRGLAVCIARSSTIRNMVELTTHVMRLQLQFAADRDEGRRLIEQQMHLDDLKTGTR